MNTNISRDLSNHVVVVTGAARGMGSAVTKALLEAGASVVALDLSWGDIDEYWTDVSQFRTEVESFGEKALVAEADINSDESLDEAYEKAIQRFGKVNALINNAALLQHHVFRPTGRVNILDTNDDHWDRMLGTNVIGTLKVIRRFVRPMLEQNSGSIINLVSNGVVPATYRPNSQEGPYMASKAAVANLSVYLAHELQENNIAVNAVIPGHAEMTGWELVDLERKAAGLRVPSSRQIPEHIAPLLLFLASIDADTGPSGQLIDTNGWNLLHGLGPAATWMRENVGE